MRRLIALPSIATPLPIIPALFHSLALRPAVQADEPLIPVIHDPALSYHGMVQDGQIAGDEHTALDELRLGAVYPS